MSTSKYSLIIICISFVLFSKQVEGQDDVSPDQNTTSTPSESNTAPSMVGLRLSANVNRFAGTDLAFGYSGGLTFTFRVSDVLSLRAETLYLSFSSQLDDREIDFPASGVINKVNYQNRNLRFHSAELPIILRFSPFATNRLKMNFYAGGSYSYNFVAYIVSDNVYSLVDSDGLSRKEFKNRYDNVSSLYSRHNASALGGIELIVWEKIGLDVRYQLGIPDLNLQNLPSTLGTVRTRMISFGVHLSF